eukprot:12155453-Ditylum_brightwellii.AAC.1
MLDIDNKKKLSCKLRYLQVTKDLPLAVEVDDLGQLTWWINTAFVVHHDMQRHTRSVMMAGK